MIDLDINEVLGAPIDCIEQWDRIESAYRELSKAIMILSGHADSEPMREAMATWLSAVVMNGDLAANAMRVLYPSKTDAPWDNPRPPERGEDKP